jgi:tripartite-type tricarboxylate transporter receptor subunit TctC
MTQNGNEQFRRRDLILGAAAAAVAAGIPSLSRAQSDFPTRTIRLVAPFPPAGAADVISRLLNEPLSRALGQVVVVENRAGSGGRIGTELVVKSAPDGYTILMGSQATNSINPELYKDLNYDPARDLVTIQMVGGVGSVLYVRPDLRVNSLQEIIDMARKNPGKLTYGSAGNGGGSHLAAALLETMANIKMTHVPYRGTAPATTDVMASQIDMLIDPIPSALPYIKGGRVRPIAVTTPKRSPSLPDLPTFDEAGVPGYEAVSYYALYAPAAVPADVLAKLRQAAKTAISDPVASKKLAEQGVIELGLTPEQAADYVAKDRKRWGEVIRNANIKVE